MLISQVHPVLFNLYLTLVAAPVVLHDGMVVWNEAVVSCFAWGRLRGTTSEQLVARPRFEPVSYRIQLRNVVTEFAGPADRTCFSWICRKRHCRIPELSFSRAGHESPIVFELGSCARHLTRGLCFAGCLHSWSVGE
jgi:hypothetical protein